MRINDEQYQFVIDGQEYHCALDVTSSFIVGKWKTVVLWYLRKDKKRFKELKDVIPSTSRIGRRWFGKTNHLPEVPPRVEYELTKEGKSLVPVLEAMAEWGKAKTKKDGKMVKAYIS